MICHKIHICNLFCLHEICVCDTSNVFLWKMICYMTTAGLQTISGSQAAPRVKPNPMYVVFHVQFDGIVRNIHFRHDITIKNFKNH